MQKQQKQNYQPGDDIACTARDETAAFIEELAICNPTLENATALPDATDEAIAMDIVLTVLAPANCVDCDWPSEKKLVDKIGLVTGKSQVNSQM